MPTPGADAGSSYTEGVAPWLASVDMDIANARGTAGMDAGGMAVGDLVVARPEGPYCPPGDFYIDPWRPVDSRRHHARP